MGSHLLAAGAAGPRLGTDVVDAYNPVEWLHDFPWIDRSTRALPPADVRLNAFLVFIMHFMYDHTAGVVGDVKTTLPRVLLMSVLRNSFFSVAKRGVFSSLMFHHFTVTKRRMLCLLHREHGTHALYRVPIHLRDRHGCSSFRNLDEHTPTQQKWTGNGKSLRLLPM